MDAEKHISGSHLQGDGQQYIRVLERRLAALSLDALRDFQDV